MPRAIRGAFFFFLKKKGPSPKSKFGLDRNADGFFASRRAFFCIVQRNFFGGKINGKKCDFRGVQLSGLINR